jgi:3,4-dihydroxy 2-butanone 4-phosphate synthase/GTP cyclohydrolase II
VLRRTGHTEATIDLARLAGLYPAGVLTEILNEDGSMARLPQLMDIAKEHDLKLISIKDLVAYRMKTERLVEKEMTTTLQTKYGEFNVAAYRQINTDDVHVAISMGNINSEDPILTKVHSNTETGDILGILFDGYADKLHSALYKISEEGKGVLLYIRHGEKGNEIIEKLKELDTNPDNNPSASTEQRDFGVGAQILRDLGVQKIKLMTSNPRKRVGLIGYGLEIVENIEMP